MLLLLLLYSFHVAAQQCYFPDSTFASTDIACEPNSKSSACCGEGGVCYTNGMCKYTDDLANGSVLIDYQRSSCTDKTWKAAECFSWCSEPWHGGSEAVRPCDGVSTGLRYCCALGLEHNGIDDYSCCLTPSNIFTIAAAASPIAIIANGTSVPIVTNNSAIAETSTKTSTEIPTEISTPVETSIKTSTEIPSPVETSTKTSAEIPTPVKTLTKTPTPTNAQSTTVASSGGLGIGDKIAICIGIPSTIAAIATVAIKLKRRKKSSVAKVACLSEVEVS